MEEKRMFVPINHNPPEHTELRPRCITCTHFPICQVREDYLKTAQLIEEIIGRPCESYKYLPPPYQFLPDFKGIPIIDAEDYFPKKVITEKDSIGEFFGATFESEEEINFIYIFDGHYMMFKAVYDELLQDFDISEGKDSCHKLNCIIQDSDILELRAGLDLLKEELIKRKDEERKKDIVNTTYFSASLDCKFYEWEKGLSYEDGIRRIVAQYPQGIPLKDGKLYHLATYHYCHKPTPLYKTPVPYHPHFHPVLAPYNAFNLQCPPPAYTRDELNEI